MILLDVRMPEMNGYEVCRRIKRDPKNRGVPILFISALNEVEDKVKGFEAEGVDYITNPFQNLEVLARVETHLKLWRFQKQIETHNVQLQKAFEHIEIKVHKRTEDLYQSPKFFLYKNISEVFSNELAAQIMLKLKLTVDTRKPQVFEYQLCMNNKNKFFESHMAVGEQEQVICIIREVTSQKLDELSRIDPLTGLSNRRDLQDKFKIQSAHSIRTASPFSVVMGDLDYFKNINDTYGHDCGDEILKQLAAIFKINVRQNDIVSRYGGEEFVIILSDSNAFDAWQKAEHIRQ